LPLQEPDYRSFAVDVKVSIAIFRTLGFVENDKCCFRGIESYLVRGQKSEEQARKMEAIDAVLVEYENTKTSSTSISMIRKRSECAWNLPAKRQQGWPVVEPQPTQ
jgi:hypothetical protein